MRGPRSRAGLIAYPVGPPSDRPMTRTSRPTGRAPVSSHPPVARSAAKTCGTIARIPNTNMNVPTISVIRFAAVLRIAGPVENRELQTRVVGVGPVHEV